MWVRSHLLAPLAVAAAAGSLAGQSPSAIERPSWLTMPAAVRDYRLVDSTPARDSSPVARYQYMRNDDTAEVSVVSYDSASMPHTEQETIDLLDAELAVADDTLYRRAGYHDHGEDYLRVAGHTYRSVVLKFVLFVGPHTWQWCYCYLRTFALPQGLLRIRAHTGLRSMAVFKWRDDFANELLAAIVTRRPVGASHSR